MDSDRASNTEVLRGHTSITEILASGARGIFPPSLPPLQDSGTASASLVHTEALSCQRPENSPKKTQISRLSSGKRGNLRLAGRIARFDRETARKMAACSWQIKERVDIDTGEMQYYSDRHCHKRHCPICEARRSRKLVSKYSSRINGLMASEGLNGYHLTLTFRNTEGLPDLKECRKLVRNFFRRKYWKERGYKGSLISFEITQNEKTGEWHPHFHCLILTERPFDCLPDGKWTLPENQAVADLWSDCTKGDSFIVRGTAFTGDLRELVKYLTKTQELEKMTDKSFENMFKWSAGKRFVSSTGILYGMAAEIEREVAAELAEEEKPIRWAGRRYREVTYEYDERLRRFVPQSVEFFDERGSPSQVQADSGKVEQ